MHHQDDSKWFYVSLIAILAAFFALYTNYLNSKKTKEHIKVLLDENTKEVKKMLENLEDRDNFLNAPLSRTHSVMSFDDKSKDFFIS
jgi:transcription initiation factor IIE alpha subunit